MRRPAVAGGLAGLGALGLLAGCGAHAAAIPAAPAGTARADVGTLHLRGGYVPAEASPDVAAAYVTITNTGTADDALLSASSPDAPMVMLHQTQADGGAEVMVPISRLPVPAGGTAALSVGHAHLMLMTPTHLLRQGETVPVTLVFARAGVVHLQLPVTAATGPAA